MFSHHYKPLLSVVCLVKNETTVDIFCRITAILLCYVLLHFLLSTVSSASCCASQITHTPQYRDRCSSNPVASHARTDAYTHSYRSYVRKEFVININIIGVVTVKCFGQKELGVV